MKISVHSISAFIITLLLAVTSLLAISTLYAQTTHAQAIKKNLCSGADLSLQEKDCKDTDVCADPQAPDKNNCERQSESKVNNVIEAIINIFSLIVGIVAVIMIIIGGFRFITSGGDAGKITSARQTVIYALVGLVIVALSQFIVRFVLSNV